MLWILTTFEILTVGEYQGNSFLGRDTISVYGYQVSEERAALAGSEK